MLTFRFFIYKLVCIRLILKSPLGELIKYNNNDIIITILVKTISDTLLKPYLKLDRDSLLFTAPPLRPPQNVKSIQRPTVGNLVKKY
jgi:hypothetical protein